MSVLSLLLVSFVPGVAPVAPAPVPIQETFDLRYHPGHDRQILDVFAPAKAVSNRPVVLFVHGGTWVSGDKNFFGAYRNIGRFLAREGVVAVLINYRLSPMVKHPEHVTDVARAFAWIQRNISKHGGDPDRIVLAGHSAGGHLVSLLASDETYLKKADLKLNEDARRSVRGVASLSGVYRVPGAKEYAAMRDIVVESLLPRNSQKLATFLRPVLRKAGDAVNPFHLAFGTDEEEQKKASPLTHVRRDMPPFLLYTAEWEVPGLRAMAHDFSAALRKAGNKVELHNLTDCEHADIMCQFHTPHTEGARTLLAFIQRVAGKSMRKEKS